MSLAQASFLVLYSITVIAVWVLLLALLVMACYNYAVVNGMSLDPDTRKPRLVNIDLWHALVLSIFFTLLFPSYPVSLSVK